jgi:hypothetical protein
MPWLSRIEVARHFKAPDFAVDLTPDEGTEFKHLVLTGPNGSGKTTILRGITDVMGQWVTNEVPQHELFDVRLRWEPEQPHPAQAWRTKEFVVASISVGNRLYSQAVAGLRAMDIPTALPGAELSHLFLEYLVDQQVQARLAKEDEPEVAAAIFAWFADLERALGELFEIPGLRLQFRREHYNIDFVEPSGLSYRFDQLPSGYASVLRILAELVLRVDALGLRTSPDLSGVVIIDEIDAFLHPALQERVLPFLTTTYPRLQFVVATHSPAVATSLRNAMVVTLGTGRSYRADTLVGTPYGQLLTVLFGLETDVDLETTRALHELQDLWELRQRTPAQQARLLELAESLQKTNNPRALEIWLQLQLAATG